MSGWLHMVLIIAGIYIGISLILYYFQEYFIFKPEKLDRDFIFHYKNQRVEEYDLKTPDGAVLNGLHFIVDRPKGVVLYLKGNSKSIKGWGKYAVDFTKHGYDVFMVDYRGFGKSTGRRSLKTLLRDLQFVYDSIKEKVDEKYIILYGRSMGSGFAAKLASTNNPSMLILDAPYYSLTKVAAKFIPFMPVSLILRYPIPTYKWLRHVNCPIHIIHGTKDKLIPLKSSIRLSKIRPKLTHLYTVIGGGHKNLTEFESYHKVLEKIIANKLNGFTIKNASIGVLHTNEN
ncbi:alpha/beta hydrolase [Aquimarina brevivitae]|uniref:Serine aminopeptidase S33 domain-containing protein n=1 Tax=Aquimarina brevivitae TaxID=323412 RepID=A0A4Q7P1E5_9FLAO|nr:alpha/beta fold hydrolase [Aquimarina brevivitae]RZS93663.1 hypothetical protein EV197_2243 [Aquimarina brevivitae]